MDNANAYNNAPAPSQPVDSGSMQPVMSPDVAAGLQKKRMLVVAAIILAVLAAVVGGVFWWTGQLKAGYLAAVPEYEHQMKEANTFFVNLDSRLEHGSDIKTRFDAVLATAPQPPTFMGISVAPKDKVQHVNDLTTTFKKFEDAYVAAADITGYSANALDIMNGAQGSISTPADMKALKDKLLATKASLQELHPGQAVKEFHEEKLRAYDTAVQDIDKALAALDQGQTAAYNEQVQKLAQDIKAVGASTASKDLGKMFDQYYAQADAAYGELKQRLGIQ